VTIHSSAGKETTIQGATDQLAGVMLPGQYLWLQALSNGSIVPGDPSPLTPLTPAHKHNYNDIINRLVSQQGTGESTIDPMSQKATTDALNLKFDKASVLQVLGAATDKVMSQKATTDALNLKFDKASVLQVLGAATDKVMSQKATTDALNLKFDKASVLQVLGAATDKVMSQKAVTDALKTLSDNFNNKLTNYLPLAGGTMKGHIRFPIGNGIVCNDVTGTAAYVVLRTWNANNSTRMYVGTVNFPTYISSTASDLIHDRNGSSYLLWDSYNLPTPASTTDLNNYLPLVGGTLTGQLTIKQSVDIKLRLQSTDADNHCIIQAINSQASQLGVFGYAGDKWAIGHGGTYYEIWDKYNLTNPVTYTTNVYNHATLTNKDGQYFTYIKAGTNGLLPHSQVTLANEGQGSCGTSDQSFQNGYFANVYTNRIMFSNNTWTNDLAANRNSNGYLQVLDAYNASSAGGPTNYGTVLQVNSKNAHWANQLWFPGGAEASKNGLYYRHMAYNGTTYGKWNKLLTNKDVNIIPTQSTSNPTTLPANQIFYSEIQNVAETPTTKGLLFSVQGDDEGIQLWASSTRTELYYRTKWTSFGNWIKLATTSDIGNYLPLTGGIVTGDIKLNTEAALYTAASSGSGYSYYKTISYDNDKGIILGASNTSIKIQSSDPRIYHIYKGTEYEIYSTNNLSTPVFAPGKVAGSLTPIYNNSFYINDSSYKVATIDNSYSFPKIYSPTSAGTAGQILQSTGGVPTWVNASSIGGNYVSKSGSTMTGILAMNSRRLGVVIDVIGGAGNSWNEGAGALSVQVPSDSGQTPLLLARRSGATINTTTLSERLLDMALLDTGTIFRVGMSGVNALELEVTSFTNKVGIGKLFGKTIATTDQIPSIPSISISNSGSGNAITAISASGHTLTVTKGATYLTSSSLGGYATQTWVNNKGYLTSHQTIYNLTFQAGTFAAKTFDPNGAAATVNIPTKTSHITNDSGFITSSALNGYATQAWVNSQNFVKSTSTKKVTDIQPVAALPATQASGVLYLVFG
jgi:hypothetical protein